MRASFSHPLKEKSQWNMKIKNARYSEPYPYVRVNSGSMFVFFVMIVILRIQGKSL
jgi:hypothetical protein